MSIFGHGFFVHLHTFAKLKRAFVEARQFIRGVCALKRRFDSLSQFRLLHADHMPLHAKL